MLRIKWVSGEFWNIKHQNSGHISDIRLLVIGGALERDKISVKKNIKAVAHPLQGSYLLFIIVPLLPGKSKEVGGEVYCCIVLYRC